jgi:heat shock protein HspQ
VWLSVTRLRQQGLYRKEARSWDAVLAACAAILTTALAPATILVYVPIAMDKTRVAKYTLGQVVRHRLFPFRGVVFDIDPEFNNTEEWYQSIPAEVRPRKDQPFYHLFAENADSEYIAYVSEQNLLPDTSGEPVRHPQVAEVFEADEKGSYRPRNSMLN